MTSKQKAGCYTRCRCLAGRLGRAFEGGARGEPGAALVIVLACLILMTAVVVAFFGSVSREYSSAKVSSDAEATRQLADSAVQIVIGQIRGATSGTGILWASQPGMIRTYNAAGQTSRVFTLYSGSNMTRDLNGGAFDPASDLPGAQWRQDKATWTDLNEPAVTSSGEVVFPIIDPRAAAAVSSSQSFVEGFSFQANKVDGAVQPTDSNDQAARLPMPVRWVYVLRDGSLTVPSGSGSTADFSTPNPIPTLANPIVGRIAFWTDDETAKLNINTACGGVPWDTPIGNSGLETLFARYQPAKNEFSRYPGHPATISLAPVLWSFLGLAAPDASVIPVFTPSPGWDTSKEMSSPPVLTVAGQAFRDKLFPLVPRNSWGGSQMGTQISAGTNGISVLAPVDSDRFFSSVDEIRYGPNEASADRAGNLLGISAANINKLRFFLTVNSKAPETNPFNLPKICIWPLPNASLKSVLNANARADDTRSPVDRLIAFCSTLSYANGAQKREYAFTRYDATSSINDFLATDVYGTQNNKILYDYLEGLLRIPLPGYGGSFADRYGTKGTEQLLTGIYDFIRSEINLVDTSWSNSDPDSPDNWDAAKVSKYAYATSLTGSLSSPKETTLSAQVVPIDNPNGTHGAGRFPVLKEVAVEFIARAANQPPYVGGAVNPMHPWVSGNTCYPTMKVDLGGSTGNDVVTTYDANYPEKYCSHPGLPYLTILNPATGAYDLPNPRYPGPSPKFDVRNKDGALLMTGSNWLPDLQPYQTQIEPVFLLNVVNPGAGVPRLKSSFKIRVKNLGNLKAEGISLFSSNQVDCSLSPNACEYNLGPARFLGSNAGFVGVPLIVGGALNNGSTFIFNGGDIQIELRDGSDRLVQTYKLSFPSATVPTPLLPIPLPTISRPPVMVNTLWTAASFSPAFPPKSVADICPSSMLTFNTSSPLALNPNAYYGGSSIYAKLASRLSSNIPSSLPNLILPQWPVINDYRGKLSSDTIRSLECAYGDARLISQFSTVPSEFFIPHRFYFDSKLRAAHSLRDKLTESDFQFCFGALPVYMTSSVKSASVPLTTYSKQVDGKTHWTPASTNNPNPGNICDVATGDDIRKMAYSPFTGTSAPSDLWPFTASTIEFDDSRFQAFQNSSSLLSGLTKFSTIWSRAGDFSSGIPGIPDGPLLGKVDEGNNEVDKGLFPYFDMYSVTGLVPVGPTLFSPNRQTPSPVVFGSLPAGFATFFNPSNPTLDSVTPWRTLLFSPNPVSPSHEALSEASLGGARPQAGRLPDFTLLDFFWMPIVEPFAISEPLSTEGKVNMNFQIAPFTYIHRDAALRGVLRSTLITAVPDKWMNNKNSTGSGASILADLGGDSISINYANFRYTINCDETLKQFSARFDGGDIFRSASEICSLWLYPNKRSASDSMPPVWDASSSAIKSWWYDDPGKECKSATGDNLREKPYASLYPLLTTKSNTYTVHFRVQTLQKAPGGDPARWVENRDRVTGEYIGSQMIERYIDSGDSKLVDFATQASPAASNLDNFYRFRILSTKRFAP